MKHQQPLATAIVFGFVFLSASAGNAQQSGRTTTGTSSGMNSLSGSGSSRTGNSFGGGTNPFSATNANQSVFQNQQSAFGLQNPGQSQQNGFIGAGGNSQNFLGANQRNQTNNQQQQNPFGNRNNRNRFNQMDLNDFNQQSGLNNQDPRRAIRPQQKVAFEIPARPATQIHSELQTRMTTISSNPNLRGIRFDLDADGVATLRGEVNTTSQKRLAENIVRLEPGIKKLHNELKVRDPFADN